MNKNLNCLIIIVRKKNSIGLRLIWDECASECFLIICICGSMLDQLFYTATLGSKSWAQHGVNIVEYKGRIKMVN